MKGDSKGDMYMAEAQQAMNRKGVMSFFTGSKQKYEDAADAFTKAGNAYKLNNAWQQAGDAFMQASDAWQQAGDNKTDAVNAIIEAGNCYKKCNPVEAVNAFHKAIAHYNDNGRFGMSARYYKEIAEIFEADHNTGASADAYEQAANMFERDNKKSNANTCRLKVATFVSEKDDGRIRAAKIFEDIAKENLSSRLGAFSAKGYLFQALLCYLSLGDQVQVRNKLDEYKNLDYSFTSSRECDFITKLIEVGPAFSSVLRICYFLNLLFISVISSFISLVFVGNGSV
jgi:alpha-soluble NSF attachment protein